MARTVYHNADIAILDDPLAAVDAHVGKHLFQKCILEQLSLSGQKEKKKTVILVTNALQYLSHSMVDRIVVFQNGRVVEQGSYTDLTNNADTVFSKFLAVMAETGVSPTTMEGCDVPGMSISDGESSTDDDEEDEVMNEESMDNKKPSTAANNGELMTDEFKERVVGKVDNQIYMAWGQAAGGAWVPFVILVAYGLVECVNVSSKWWLTYCKSVLFCVSRMFTTNQFKLMRVLLRVCAWLGGKSDVFLGNLCPY